MISIMMAMSENRAIGINGRLPWNIPADLQRFRHFTTNHTIIMGRKTHESIGRLLPDRQSIIISRNLAYRVKGATVASSLDEALSIPEAGDEVFVIGGAEIFQLAIPKADRLYLTTVHADIEGDVFLPTIDYEPWEMWLSYTADEIPYNYSFSIYDRRVPT